MLQAILAALWMFFPMIGIFIVLSAFWWPRTNMDWGRIFAISFTSGLLMMLYSAIASDVFDQIQSLAIPG